MALPYGIILRHYCTALSYGIIIWHYPTALLYGAILWDYCTALSYGTAFIIKNLFILTWSVSLLLYST